MSGGGVFIRQQLIGINSTHPQPLWPGSLKDLSGEAVDQSLNQKLDLLALGISIQWITQAIENRKQPSLVEWSSMHTVRCDINP